MLRLPLLVVIVLVLVLAGLSYLGLSRPAYHPQQISQPVALPNAAH